MDIFKFLKKHGIDTVSASFYAMIRLWDSWYAGDVKSFHHYRIYNGKSHIRMKRMSLGMAKKLSEDMADFLINEKVGFTIDGSDSTFEFVKRVLAENKFWAKCNEYQERKCATGTSAYVVQVTDGMADVDGNLYGGKISIDYLSAESIFPISWNKKEITECAFVFDHTYGGKQYSLIQMHRLESGQYVIYNYVVLTTSGAGKELTEEQWKAIPNFSNLPSKVYTGSDIPLFVIDKLNIVNNVDSDTTNPMGISIFANSIDVLSSIDLKYDSYANEFNLGRKRIFVSPEMLFDMNGEPAFDSNDTVFYQLPEEMLKGDKPIHEVNMELRSDAHSKAIDDDLNLLSVKCGFGTRHYKFDSGSIQTAKQVVSENSDLYRTIKKHEIILEDVLHDLIRIIIRLGVATGVSGITEDVDIKIDFDDSIIEDKETERNQDRQDVANGSFGLDEYRAKWRGETIEQARENLPQQMGVMLE